MPTQNYAKIYAAFLSRFFNIERPIRVVFDCSDGTAGIVLRELMLLEPNATNWILNAKPNGRFPAHGPNPLAGNAFESLGREVLERKADLGIVFDGDADRVFFVDNEGSRVSPDLAALLIAKNFKGSTIVDIRSGFVLREGLKRAKIKILESRVGHFFIKKLMRSENVPFGAEVSGHYYFKDFFYADSGILAAIYVMNEVSKIMKAGEKLSEWAKKLPQVYSSGELNFQVDDKEAAVKRVEEAFKRRARVTSKLDGVRMDFGTGKKEWWFNVRPSNTENLLRLNMEAKDKEIFIARLKDLKTLIG